MCDILKLKSIDPCLLTGHCSDADPKIDTHDLLLTDKSWNQTIVGLSSSDKHVPLTIQATITLLSPPTRVTLFQTGSWQKNVACSLLHVTDPSVYFNSAKFAWPFIVHSQPQKPTSVRIFSMFIYRCFIFLIYLA